MMALPDDSGPYYIGTQNWSNAVHPCPDSGLPPPYGSSRPPGPAPIPSGPGAPTAGCPPGLEYLTQIDQLLIHQRVDFTEMIIGWEMCNAYVVKNSVGQQVFTATEDGGNFFATQFLGPLRPFTIHIQDHFGREVLTVKRPVGCGACCFPCCLQEVEVQSPPGVPIGRVVQNWHPLWPKFTVTNANGSAQLKIKGPFCDCKCCSDVVFEVLSADEESVVGQISKQWGGFLQEGFSDADNFGISFPMDLDAKVKAVLLGAVFLIDFMYFETSKNQN